ncbi:MAG: hypothetical protein J7K64_01725 [Bacteroidales bacterium]|nr:hypothetical protein [Bacteroidales bacterium]
MRSFFTITFFFSLIFFSGIIYSQPDTVNKNNPDTLIYEGGKEVTILVSKKKHPKRAALFSAVLPGAGQVYNQKYWKVPIVYSALGTAAFLFQYNNKQYHKFLTGYQQRIDTSLDETIFSDEISTDRLLEYKNSTRRNRDLSVVIFSAVYVLNIIDATVDAELSDFDISDDLSLKISPEIIPLYGKMKKNTIGLTFCFNLK